MSTDVRSYKHKLHHLQPRSSAAVRGALIYLPRLSLMQFRCCHITVLLYSSSFIFSLTTSLSPSAENETLPKPAVTSRDSQRRKICSSLRVNIPADQVRRVCTGYKRNLTN